jgi:hypothetical protein
MGNKKTTYFCKQHACPSAEMLLSYKGAKLCREQEVKINMHLIECDFCCAELHLLTHNEQEEISHTQTAEIPAHLRALAESILDNYYFGDSLSFNDMIFEREDMSFTDV